MRLHDASVHKMDPTKPGWGCLLPESDKFHDVAAVSLFFVLKCMSYGT